MAIKFLAKVAAPTLGLAAVVVAATVSVATAEPAPPPPSNASGCETGYVPRNARPGDDVCVSRDFARRTATENANPAANKEPNGGAYGPDTCKPGFVWREAFDGDTICVTPDIRAQNKAASADPDAHRVEASDGDQPPTEDGAPQPTPSGAPKPTPEGGPEPEPQAAQRTVVFEITGSGTVYSIDMDPAKGERVGENTAVPFKREVKIDANVGLLTVNAVTKTGTQGCRILLDGKVVAEQPAPNAFCTFAIP